MHRKQLMCRKRRIPGKQQMYRLRVNSRHLLQSHSRTHSLILHRPKKGLPESREKRNLHSPRRLQELQNNLIRRDGRHCGRCRSDSSTSKNRTDKTGISWKCLFFDCKGQNSADTSSTSKFCIDYSKIRLYYSFDFEISS